MAEFLLLVIAVLLGLVLAALNRITAHLATNNALASAAIETTRTLGEQAGRLSERVDDIAVVIAYSAAEQGQLGGLYGEPDYAFEKDLNKAEANLLYRARRVVRGLAR